MDKRKKAEKTANNEKISGVVRLRTLTMKSIVPYGKYEGQEVSKVLTMSKMAIRWLYYCVQWISFTDDVLEVVGIKGKWRIDKPATDREAYEKWKNIMFEQLYGDKRYFIRRAQERKAQVARVRVAERKENLSAEVMVAQNHGHIKF